MHIDRHFFCYWSVLRSGKPICLKICLKMQICIEGIGENAILMMLLYQIRALKRTRFLETLRYDGQQQRLFYLQSRTLQSFLHNEPDLQSDHVVKINRSQNF